MNISKFTNTKDDFLNSRNLDKCKDCKWMIAKCGIYFCEHPRVVKSIKYVLTNTDRILCSIVRKEYTIGNQPGCGPKAKLFEPKPKTQKMVRNPHQLDIMNEDQIDYDKCRSCKWYLIEKGETFGEYRYCTNPVILSSNFPSYITRVDSRVMRSKPSTHLIDYANSCGPEARYHEDITVDMDSSEYIEFLESQPLEIIEQYGLWAQPKPSFWSSIKRLIKRILQRT